jgi:carboxylate-amine ligase
MSLFTLGIEEEFQTIDPETRDLRSHMSKIVEGGKISLQERVKAEMHQAVVEVGTNICYNIQQARDEVIYLRKHIIELADAQNLKVAAAGTHPFADWQDQLITDNPRYDALIDEMRDVAREFNFRSTCSCRYRKPKSRSRNTECCSLFLAPYLCLVYQFSFLVWS